MTPSQNIDAMIAEYTDWRGPLLARLRKAILAADPGMTEEWKWNTAVWTNNGLVCATGGFKDHVKVNFFKGASLDDSKKLFNSGLEAKNTRAIDFYEKDTLDDAALTALVKTAVAYNAKK